MSVSTLTSCLKNVLNSNKAVMIEWCQNNNLLGNSISMAEFDNLPEPAVAERMEECFSHVDSSVSDDKIEALSFATVKQFLLDTCQLTITHDEL
jgi:hypothetical protein